MSMSQNVTVLCGRRPKAKTQVTPVLCGQYPCYGTGPPSKSIGTPPVFQSQPTRHVISLQKRWLQQQEQGRSSKARDAAHLGLTGVCVILFRSNDFTQGYTTRTERKIWPKRRSRISSPWHPTITVNSRAAARVVTRLGTVKSAQRVTNSTGKNPSYYFGRLRWVKHRRENPNELFNWLVRHHG